MQDKKATARGRLVEALQSLRAILARGPEVRFPGPITHAAYKPKFPRATEVWQAAEAVLEALQHEPPNGQLDVSIADPRTLVAIQGAMLNDVGLLDRLPAPWILPPLNTMIKALGGKVPHITSIPLPDTQQRVYDLIQAEGPIMGAAICRRVGIEQASLTAHIIPELKKKPWGVKNRRGAGYYV